MLARALQVLVAGSQVTTVLTTRLPDKPPARIRLAVQHPFRRTPAASGEVGHRGVVPLVGGGVVAIGLARFGGGVPTGGIDVVTQPYRHDPPCRQRIVGGACPGISANGVDFDRVGDHGARGGAAADAINLAVEIGGALGKGRRREGGQRLGVHPISSMVSG